MQQTWVGSLGWEEPLEEEMATHSSILAWKIPCTEEPGGLQFMGPQRVTTLKYCVYYLLGTWRKAIYFSRLQCLYLQEEHAISWHCWGFNWAQCRALACTRPPLTVGFPLRCFSQKIQLVNYLKISKSSFWRNVNIDNWSCRRKF